MSNLIAIHADKLQHFVDQQQKNRVVMYLARTKRIHPYLRALLNEMMGMIDGTTTTEDLDLFEETLRKATTDLDDPKIFMVSVGEDFCLVVDLEEGKSFEGYMLAARLASNGSLLSDNDIAGTAEDLQEIVINDISLAAGKYFKINATLEHPDGSNLASGNVSALLTEVIVLMQPNVDSA